MNENRQKETIEKLQKDYKSTKTAAVLVLSFGVVTALISIVFAMCGEIESFILLLVIALPFFVIYSGCKSKMKENLSDIEIAKMDIDKYDAIVKEREEKQKAQMEAKNAPPSLTKDGTEIHCPTCGSTNVERISMASKAVDTAAFGILGTKRKMQFKCRNCKYMW